MQKYSDRTLNFPGGRSLTGRLLGRSCGEPEAIGDRPQIRLGKARMSSMSGGRPCHGRRRDPPSEDDMLGLAFSSLRSTSTGGRTQLDAGPRHGSRTLRPASSRPQSGSLLLAGSQQTMPPPIGVRCVRCVRASGTADAVRFPMMPSRRESDSTHGIIWFFSRYHISFRC